MLSFYTGDELGNIKKITCRRETSTGDAEGGGWKLEDHVVLKASGSSESITKEHKVKNLACAELGQGNALFSVARANGAVQIASPDSNGKLQIAREWKGKGPADKHSFVGMSLRPSGAFWCSSSGLLNLAKSAGSETGAQSISEELQCASLPMNLRCWQASADSTSFCYGGTEVDVSVWDTTRAFIKAPQSGQAEGKKRSRGNELFPAEIWRAKNLPNDNLNLRHPINITSVAYLSSSTSANSAGGVHLVSGTEQGDVRRYDTRAARRPVANWIGIGKVGGVGNVTPGLHEHELFISDKGTNLSSVDLRNGRVIYSYKQIQGAISGLAPSSNYLGSLSYDRLFRLHSTVPPPETAGKHQDERGEVLGSLYTKSIATAIVVDPSINATSGDDMLASKEAAEDPWEELANVSDEEDIKRPKRARRH